MPKEKKIILINSQENNQMNKHTRYNKNNKE